MGRALVRQLALDLPHHRLLLLTRRPTELLFPGAEVAFADISQSDLGLTPSVRHLLHERTELFVHSAADTHFNLPLPQSRRTNTEGTCNAISVARQCRRLRHFAHISTLYVAGRRQGRVSEQPLRHSAGYVNSYEASKHEAEELILAESANLPVGIYRLSSVAALSGRDGHVRKVLRLALWASRFRFFPGEARVPVDIISSEWAAQALSALLREHAEPGCIRHVCAGESGCIPLYIALEKTLTAYQSFTGRPRPHVDLIPLHEFERLRRIMSGDEAVARALGSLMTFIPHLSLMQPFDNTVTSSLLHRSKVEAANVDSVLSALLAQELRPPALDFSALPNESIA